MFSAKFLVVMLPIREASPMPLTLLKDLKANSTKIMAKAIIIAATSKMKPN